MNREKIVQLLKEQLEVKPPEGLNFLKKERMDQYKKIFGSDILSSRYATPNSTDESVVNHSDTFYDVINSYFEEIFTYNPVLTKIRDDLELITVYTDKEATRMLEVGDKSTIFFDSFLMQYIWMLNKAYLYRDFHSPEDNYILHVNIFMHFATLMQPNKFKFVFPKPKTPPHQDADHFYTLSIATKIQETFMLAHEIAHHLIKHSLPTREKFSSSRLSDYLLNESDLIWGENETIKNEVLADDIAFDLVMNIYNRGENKPEVVQAVSTFIYLFIRYLLWQRVVFKEQKEDYEFHLWFSRNSSMRRKIGQAYAKWGRPLFLVDLFDDYIEDVLEPAAFLAKERLSEILKVIEENNTSQ